MVRNPSAWFLLSVFTCATAFASGKTAAPRVIYSLSVPSPDKRFFHVDMKIPCMAGSLQLQIPSFRSGDAGTRHYDRFIEHLRASLAKRNLETKRIDPYTWTVSCPISGGAHVEYDVEVDPQDDLQLDNHWVDEAGGYFDSASLFLYSKSSADLPILLKLALPALWKAATSLPQQEGGFFARNYAALVDSPVLFGTLVERTITVGGVPHRLVFPSSLPPYDSDALDADVAKIAAYEINLFGSAPFTSYVALFRWRPDMQFGGGIEHAGGMFMNIGKEWMPDLAPRMRGTFAHEYFHAWNAEAIYPSAYHKALTRKQVCTDLLWFQEGVTDYFADLVLVRTGLFSLKDFYSSLSQTVTQFEGGASRGFLSLADASTIAGSHSVEDLDYYSGGEVVGLLLDLRIRMATRGRRSLDDVMRRLYAESRETGYSGYREEDIAAAVNGEAGVDLRPLLRQMVHGKDRASYDSLFEGTGLSVSATREADGSTSYVVSIRQDATEEQLQRLKEMVATR